MQNWRKQTLDNYTIIESQCICGSCCWI